MRRARFCGPTCLPFSIVLSGVTGVVARHGARFRKASRAAPLLSLSLSLFLYLSIYLSIYLSLTPDCPAIFFPHPLCPATSTEHREVTGGWYILFFSFASVPPPILHPDHHRYSLSSLSSLLSFSITSSSSSSLSLVRSFLFLSRSFSSFSIFFSNERSRVHRSGDAQRGQLDGLLR